MKLYNSSEEELIEEILDRQECAKNIIMFNIPEIVQNTEVNRDDENSVNLNNLDLSKVNNIIDEMFTDDIDSSKPSILKVSRIGRKITDRPRPIKVSFASSGEAIEIIRKKNIYRNESFNISLDKTKKQRHIYNEVRKQLSGSNN